MITKSANLWTEFLSYENFLLAWQRVVNVSSRIIKDEVGMQAFAHNLQANLEDLIQRIQREVFSYKASSDHKVYVPKPSTTLRTMSLMSAPDLVVYHALVNVIADHVYPEMVTHEDTHVLGNVYAGPKRRWMLKRWKWQYNKFVGKVNDYYNQGNLWVASTDIVSFYDTIEHRRLLDLVERYCGKDERFRQLLEGCLSTWSAHNKNAVMSRGIPQGSNASDLLANFFLYEIDQTMIAEGYHYLRYVDDVRIFAPNRAIAQMGLIRFDLALKQWGLVAQVSKTSVHEISDIGTEIVRMRFIVTDPSGTSICEVDLPTTPSTEQAEAASEYVYRTPSELVETEGTKESSSGEIGGEALDEEDEPGSDSGQIDIQSEQSPAIQAQLLRQFQESFIQLDDPRLGKQADTNLTYCLRRLDPNPEIRQQVYALVSRMPWRSEALSNYLERCEGDEDVIRFLIGYLDTEQVYSWHRANLLNTLKRIGGAGVCTNICRSWISDNRLEWFARTIAVRALADTPGQHAFLVEQLKREQKNVGDEPEGTAILRQELAFVAFQRTRSFSRQLTLLRLILEDKSLSVRRLAIYLLQQPNCKVGWEHLGQLQSNLQDFAELLASIGIVPTADLPCFISQTFQSMYDVTTPLSDFRPIFRDHYQSAVKNLRDSVGAYHSSPERYVDSFHKFFHMAIVAFYESVLPNESGLMDSDYSQLLQRQAFKSLLPRGLKTWELLGALRNRVAHPYNRATKSRSEYIKVAEVEILHKEIIPALQEFCDALDAKSSLVKAQVSGSSTSNS